VVAGQSAAGIRWPAIPSDWRKAAPIVVTGVAFLVLFWQPMATLARDWWTDPEAGHGLLLGPLAIIFAWRRGMAPGSRPQPVLGLVLLSGAVLLRYVSGLAAELFTMRLSLLSAGMALVVFVGGVRQLRHWWLSATLLLLSVPLPAVVLSSLAFPLQLRASQLGALLLQWRHVPVAVAGNVIHLPGRSLFVTEACSGLRSLTALLSLGVLIGALFLRSTVARAVLVLASLPVAMLLNAIRIFLTGFLVYFVSPALGEGMMHYSEGWALFLVAFALLGGLALVAARVERLARSPWRTV
jgi:exosortase